ncbi:TPA: hypothetical protein U2M37_002756 [Providencia stuartii]|nr:hypothetical protein [Providencia stuartii]HEM8194458.1 hypothetical protein [Providencia stuartii]
MAIQGLFIEARLLDSGLKLTFDNEMKLTSKLEEEFSGSINFRLVVDKNRIGLTVT